MNKLLAALLILYSTLRILVSLIWTWLTISWRVRKARRAFESELIKVGISEGYARRLSSNYIILKDQLFSLTKGLSKLLKE